MFKKFFIIVAILTSRIVLSKSLDKLFFLKDLSTSKLIDLTNKNIESIPNGTFDSFGTVEYLYLSWNVIKQINQSNFIGLNNLFKLDISSNLITKIESNSFSNLTDLSSLELSYNQLVSLESNVFNGLTNLRELNLFKNNLNTISKDLFDKLPSLKYLDLAFNELEHLDANVFSSLSRLTTLWIYTNKIKSIDSNAFNGLTSLNFIHMSFNELNKIEQGTFNNLTSLEKLILTGNKLSNIDAFMFSGLRNLEELSLDSNNISNVDKSAFNQTCHLKHISFLIVTLSLLSLNRQLDLFPIIGDNFNFDLIFDEFANQTLNSTKACNSFHCHYIRDVFKGQMNMSVDPCEDFYKFSCGNFLDKNQNIPSGVLERLHIEFLRKTDDILLDDETYNLSSITNTKRFYNSCKEQDSSDFLSSMTRYFRGISILNNKTSQINLTTNNNNSNQAESNSIYNLILMNRLGFDVLFELRVDINPHNTSQYAIWIERTSVMSSTFEEFALHSILIEITKSKKINWTDYIDSLNTISNEFSQIELNSPTKDTPKHEQITIKELQLKIPHFNWSYFLIDGVYKNDLNYSINENEIIIYNDLDYLFAITKVFHKYTIENEPHLNDLLIWTFVISELGPYKYFMNAIPFNFSSLLSDDQFDQPSESVVKFGSGHCLSFTNELMKFPIARLLVNKYFNKSNISMTRIKEIVDNVKNEFISVINENDWMDVHTRNVSLHKINSMEIKIGYPDFIFDDQTLEELYKEFQFGENFFENLIKLRRINFNENILLLLSKVNKTLWKSNPFDVNAYYYPLFNQIYLSAGLLVLPIFHDLIPNYLNYGSLGTIIGHEIIHGFDSNGRFYDKDGQFYSDDSGALWTNKSVLIYENRTQCLVDQFNDFFKHETNKSKTNGLETLAENIADNMGLQLSYKAFKKWSQSNDAELPIHEFENFTPDQMFFISYGQIWCEVNTSVEKLSSTKTYHSPHSFRVNGAVSNFDDFYKAFKCNKNNENNICKLF